jgi:TonB family protein
VQADAFHIRMKDEIAFNSVLYSNVNLDPTQHDGVNLSARYGFDRRSFVRLGYTYREARFRAGVFDGNSVPEIPRHNLSLTLLWQLHERHQLGLQGNYTGERYFGNDQANAGKQMPDHTLWKLHYAYAARDWKLRLAVANLTDVSTADLGFYNSFAPNPYFYYPLPERSVTATLEKSSRNLPCETPPCRSLLSGASALLHALTLLPGSSSPSFEVAVGELEIRMQPGNIAAAHNPRTAPRADAAQAPLPDVARDPSGDSPVAHNAVSSAAGDSAAIQNHLRGVLHSELSRYLRYPPLARERGWEGTVVVSVEITARGDLQQLRLLHTSGHTLLDDVSLASLRCIRQLPVGSRWQPAAPVQVILPIRFHRHT